VAFVPVGEERTITQLNDVAEFLWLVGVQVTVLLAVIGALLRG